MAASPPLQPHVVAPSEGSAYWFLGTLVLLKATGAATGGAFGLIEQVAPPGFGPPLHVHRGEDELFYLVEGEATFVCDGRQWRVGSGAAVFLPRDRPHTFRIEGDAPARLLQFTFPAGLERFFAELGEPAPALTLPPPAPPDVDGLLALAPKYRFEILGPPLGD